MLKIAIPNKGALSELAVKLIKDAGYKCSRSGRELVVRDTQHEIDFFFLRPRDIAVYVSNGIVDLGITGRDLAIDSEATYAELLALNFGFSRFFYAIPKESALTPDTFHGARIATSYPTIVKQDLAARNVQASIVELDGAVEISIELGVADAIADVVESGRTLVEAGLKTIGDPILESEAILISREQDKTEDTIVKTFIQRLHGTIIARQYLMVEYDVDQEHLEAAMKLTPGIESPTVSSLRDKGWFAVKAMVKAKGVNTLLDELHATGAKGIIASAIMTCRL